MSGILEPTSDDTDYLTFYWTLDGITTTTGTTELSLDTDGDLAADSITTSSITFSDGPTMIGGTLFYDSEANAFTFTTPGREETVDIFELAAKVKRLERTLESYTTKEPVTQIGKEREMTLTTGTWIMIGLLAFVIAKFVVPRLTLRYVLRAIWVRVKHLKDEWKKAKVG